MCGRTACRPFPEGRPCPAGRPCKADEASAQERGRARKSGLRASELWASCAACLRGAGELTSRACRPCRPYRPYPAARPCLRGRSRLSRAGTRAQRGTTERKTSLRSNRRRRSSRHEDRVPVVHHRVLGRRRGEVAAVLSGRLAVARRGAEAALGAVQAVVERLAPATTLMVDAVQQLLREASGQGPGAGGGTYYHLLAPLPVPLRT